MAEKKTLAKVVDFEPLGALFGPGAPDADLAPFRKRFCELETIMNSNKTYFYNADRIWRCHVQSMSTPKPLLFLAKMNQRTPCTLHVLSMYSTKTL